jgi:hypothetical protein
MPNSFGQPGRAPTEQNGQDEHGGLIRAKSNPRENHQAPARKDAPKPKPPK